MILTYSIAASRTRPDRAFRLVLFSACVSLVLFSVASGQTPTAGQWPLYGADQANTKYSPLDLIDRENVGQLEIAWTWESPDTPLQAADRRLGAPNFELTPLMVDGVLYASTSLSQAAAIDAGTGDTLWVFDPEIYKRGRPPNWGYVHRGVTYHEASYGPTIFYGTGDGRLIALDAATGKPRPHFGDAGQVDLKTAVPRLASQNHFGVSSPPVISRGVIIVGSSISDRPASKTSPPGIVQAFDVETGAPRWTFNLIPNPGDPGSETWEDGAEAYTGGGNWWTMGAADDELGYVYVPTGTPTNDWYGGHRPGDGHYAESLLCLEAETGRLVWHFQLVHHGLWDYDFPAAPVLADITVEGRAIKAVAQISKQGFCYVFDRGTGEPVWPIIERPVPPSDVVGERASPTQPIPTKPPPFERQGITEDDLIDFTPELRAAALEIVKHHRLGPLFTPPSLRGTLQLPGSSGGANWGGAALDPETSLLYIPSITSPILVKLGEPDPSRSEFDLVRVTPRRIEGPGGPKDPEDKDAPPVLPLTKPPYGRITAIDLNSGDIAWQVVRGDGPRDHPLLKDLDLPPLGQIGRAGVLLTKTLLFVGDGTTMTNSAGTSGGSPKFRAHDKATGAVLWETDLPAEATASPMTYLYEGRQYIAVATADRESPATLVALSLP